MGLQSHPPHLNTAMKKRDGGLPCHCRNLWRCAGRASAANPRPGVQSAVSANRHPEQLSLSILQQLVLFTWPSNLMFMMTAEPASGTGGESDSVTCLTVSGFPAGVSALLRDLLLFAMQERAYSNTIYWTLFGRSFYVLVIVGILKSVIVSLNSGHFHMSTVWTVWTCLFLYGTELIYTDPPLFALILTWVNCG